MIISDILSKNGVDENKCQKFQKYFELLIDWNNKINLTAITEETDVATKHFLDSISVFKSGVINEGYKVIDIGTGAGFPGIPMKIYDESLSVTLLDSLNKRITFLNEVISTLRLNNISCVHGRAEDFGRDKAHREKYDVCVSRAVANLATLSELCLPFVKVGGYFVAMKGPKAEEEIEMGKKAIKLLGGEIVDVLSYPIEGTDLEHNMVLVKKISQISEKYPRKAPKPSKEPLV